MSHLDTLTAGGRATAHGQRIKQAWGQHLGRYPWDHFLTLTFRRESVADFARRSWLSYVRRLELAAGMPLVWFYGTEYGSLGRLHIHALTLNTGSLPIRILHREWWQDPPLPRGLTKIAVYSPLLGAAHYVSKYVTKDLADYDVSDRLREAAAARGRQFVIPLGPRFVFDALARHEQHRAARRHSHQDSSTWQKPRSSKRPHKRPPMTS